MKEHKPAGKIGNLRLRLPHMRESDALWIGQEVARTLAAIPAPPPRQVASLHVRLRPADGRAEMARLITESIVRNCR